MCICQMNIKHLTKHKVTLNSGGWQIQNKLHIFFFSQYNQLSVSKSIGLQEEYTINKLANQNTLILYVWFVKKKNCQDSTNAVPENKASFYVYCQFIFTRVKFQIT